MNKKINTYKSFLILGILLIISALTLVMYNLISDYIAGNKSKNIVDNINININANTNNTNTNTMKNTSDNIDPDKKMPTIEYNGISYIGVITIENIGVKLPVISSYSQDYLKIAPTLYKGSIYKNDAVIIAHNYKSHFGNLDKLSLGDKVEFMDIEGNIFNYEVINKENIYQENSSQLYGGEWNLTLFTCKNIDMKYRTVIRLKRV